MQIQEIATPAGLHAWLVEEHGLPIVFVEMFWRAGATSEAAHLGGLAYMLSGLLDEGAGDLDSEAFQKRLADLNIELSFHASRDSFSVSLKTLEENLDQAFELMSLALTAPRFDTDAVERVRAQLLASLRQDAKDPETIASRAWFAAAFPGHAYGRSPRGTPETIEAIQPADLRDWLGRALARDNIGIAVVGAISPQRLQALLDKSLAHLPAESSVSVPAQTRFQAQGGSQTIDFPNPQSVIRFGHGGPLRQDEDFIPAYVMNYILGGGSLVSRLGDEVREKRGLAYSVYSFLYPLDQAGLFIGSVATENARAGQAIAQIRDEIARLRDHGVTEEDLAAAKAYLTGSYPLRFDSSEKIAGQLSGIQRQRLGIDYVETRNSLIEAVTREDVQRAARAHLHLDSLLAIIVGQPEGINPPE